MNRFKNHWDTRQAWPINDFRQCLANVNKFLTFGQYVYQVKFAWSSLPAIFGVMTLISLKCFDGLAGHT